MMRRGSQGAVHLDLGRLLVLDLGLADAHGGFQIAYIADRLVERLFQGLGKPLMEDTLDRFFGIAGPGNQIVPEGSGERIADDNPVVEKRERHPLGMRFQPKRQFGQFDGQRVLIDAVEAVNGHQAAAQRLGPALRIARLLSLGRPAGQIAEQFVVWVGQRGDPLTILLGLGQGRLAILLSLGRFGAALGGRGLLVAEPDRPRKGVVPETGTTRPGNARCRKPDRRL